MLAKHRKQKQLLRVLIPITAVALLISSSMSYALSTAEARHLLSRTGFTPSFAEIDAVAKLNKTQAIDYQLNSIRQTSQTPLQEQFKIPYKLEINLKKASKEEKKAYRKKMRKQSNELKAWWLNEMLTTNSPMTENLTLFWHNHFVTSNRKVKHPAFIAKQNQTLRKYALGNFGDFTKAILKDPAMIRYLDNHQNRKGKPNENLARELMELFTLGEGHYSEDDIKQAAKALSGNSIDPKTGLFQFRSRQHDSSNKTIFGKRGNFDSDDLADLILAKQQTARYITEKIWNHYITTPIPAYKLDKLSRRFYRDYELKPLIRSILLQDEFWHKDNIGTKIKHPINMIVGTFRLVEHQPKNLKPLLKASAQMGQNILTPPNVKGWNTGTGWINTTTLIARQSLLAKATRGMQLKGLINKQNKSKQNWLDATLPYQLQDGIDKNQDTWLVVKAAINDISYQLE